jgi:DNA-binding NarL/FixJ family response regulator
MQPFRIIVADDHPLIRASLQHELARHDKIELVGHATTTDETLRQVQLCAPDLVLMDLSMPGRPALETIAAIVALPRAPRVLVLTAHTTLDSILPALKAGISGYVLKSEECETIVAAINAVMKGTLWMSSQITSQLVIHTVREQPRSAADQLSLRELDVLQHLAEGKDNFEISTHLHISERTVRFHLRNIYDKLGMRRGEVIAWSIRNRIVQPALSS